MKPKISKKKITFNKITISHLDNNQAMDVMGGITGSCIISGCILCQPTKEVCPTKQIDCTLDNCGGGF